MKRVDVRMSDTFRGRVSDYAKDEGKSMPQAYRDIMELGLGLVSEDGDFVRDELLDELADQLGNSDGDISYVTIVAEDKPDGVEYTLKREDSLDNEIANRDASDSE
jgi:hypothetical protein